MKCALQTRDGYLWFGFEEGLARYNGVDFQVYDARNTPELSRSDIRALAEDHEGNLWIGMNGGGVAVLREGRFRAYGAKEGLGNLRITALAVDGAGTLWGGTDGGGLYRRSGERFDRLPGETKPGEMFIRCLTPDSEGTLWVGYNNGLKSVKAGKVTYELLPAPASGRPVNSMCADPQGHLWVATADAVFQRSRGVFERVPVDTRLARVNWLSLGGDGSLWIGGIGGILRCFNRQSFLFDSRSGLKGGSSEHLLCDHEGSLWVGSDVPGIDQLRPAKFQVYSAKNGLSSDNTTVVLQSADGDMWVGTQHGLNRLHSGRWRAYTRANGLPDDFILSLGEDHTGAIWVGTRFGLGRITADRCETFGPTNGVPRRPIWCIYCDRSRTPWFGTVTGLLKHTGSGFELFDHDRSGLSHNDVRAICEDSAGSLWVGTSYGLNRLEGSRFVCYLPQTTGLPLEVVISLYADMAGTLWIGTAGNGLFRYHAGKFNHYAPAQGLFDNAVHVILEDGQGNLWLSCNRGVYRVPQRQLRALDAGETAKLTPTIFGKAQGLPSADCSGAIQPAGWRTREGSLWFPTAEGIAVINPSQVWRNPLPPPVHIEGVRVDGVEAEMSRPMRLKGGPGQVEFDCAALSFVAPRQVRYKYRLEGLDQDWSPPSDIGRAYYSHLPPGAYEFAVTACNNDGVWNAAGDHLAVVVAPFFWQTALFQFGLGAALLGLTGLAAWGVATRRHRRQLALLEQRHALDLERTRIAQDMHDGVGAGLVRIALLGEIVEGQLGEPEQARRQLQKITRIARQVVRDMDEIVWAINPRNDTLDNLASYLCQFAREHFADTEVHCDLDVPVELPPRFLPADLRHHLFLAVKEALNNVLKHAGASKVRLRLTFAGAAFGVLVEDNGRGFSAGDRRPGSDGLSNLEKRVATLGGRFECCSRPGEGTRIELVVPIPPE